MSPSFCKPPSSWLRSVGQLGGLAVPFSSSSVMVSEENLTALSVGHEMSRRLMKKVVEVFNRAKESAHETEDTEVIT